MLSLSSMFTDHMVLQQGVAVPVWGCAPDGCRVTVSFRGQQVETVAAGGRWIVHLAALAAGGPDELIVRAGAIPAEHAERGDGQCDSGDLEHCNPDTDHFGTMKLIVRDVLVGEVWLAAGQSNMVQQLLFTEGGVAESERADYSTIRLFTVPRRSYPEGREPDWAFIGVTADDAVWKVCTPEHALHFSAIGYYFAVLLEQERQVPVGIVSCNWGGTPIQAWMSEESLRSDPETSAIWEAYAAHLRTLDGECYEADFAAYIHKIERQIRERGDIEARVRSLGLEGYRAWVAEHPLDWSPQPLGPKAPERPCGLYASMLQTVAPFAVRGVLWYQGESNANESEAPLYGRLLRALIADWRSLWGSPELPFLIVQLSSFAAGGDFGGSRWALIREAQDDVSQKAAHTALAVTLDCGEARDIHPVRKKPIAERLALAARAVAYGESVEYQAPRYRSYTVEGAAVRVLFDQVGEGLVGRGGSAVAGGFAICGEDRRYVSAEGFIDGDTVVVSSPLVACPVAVRYAWGNCPDAGLFARSGLPVAPFRTDRNEG
jgi:sialate O-acetylesterase